MGRSHMEKTAQRIHEIMEESIRSGEVAGCNLLALQDGDEVMYLEAGHADIRNDKKISRNSIFRLYSQTKPITSAAVMLLLERGKLDLMDDISMYLPNFRHPKVYENGSDVPARRGITVMDLLGMTSGLCYPDADIPGQKMGELFEENQKKMDAGQGMSTIEFCDRMGSVPLSHQPGTNFRYGTSADVLGAIVEVVSGKKFGTFLREEFFEPLHMKDTGFYVKEREKDRLVTCYERAFGSDANEMYREYEVRHLCIRDHAEEPAFQSGGAGLYSTLDDYAHFATMLLQGGKYGNTRILRRETVEFMTQPQVDTTGWDNLTGYGYGKLMRICTEPGKCQSLAKAGEYGWDGWLGTYFANFPKENLTILLGQNTKDTGTGRLTRRIRNCIISQL
ncbi:MAG: beta-lactamase family protein [Clostridia bacterium]|nr:beta-lactamase family protein [Clostridia bacterium]